MLRERFAAALKEALKARDERRVSTLRLILAALQDRDIAARSNGGGEHGPITDDEILEMLGKMVRQRQESISLYEEAGRMGLHRDDAESEAALARGSPVVSLSFGDECVFALAPSRDSERTRTTLRSGDALVFGGPSRLVYHGVERVKAGTAPATLGMRAGRLNLTFRSVL